MKNIDVQMPATHEPMTRLMAKIPRLPKEVAVALAIEEQYIYEVRDVALPGNPALREGLVFGRTAPRLASNGPSHGMTSDRTTFDR